MNEPTDARTVRVMLALARLEALVNSTGEPQYLVRARMRVVLDEARAALLLNEEKPDATS